jgi:hypothetical protein
MTCGAPARRNNQPSAAGAGAARAYGGAQFRRKPARAWFEQDERTGLSPGGFWWRVRRVCESPPAVMFNLTREQQVFLCAVLLLVLTGRLVKAWRTAHPPPTQATSQDGR